MRDYLALLVCSPSAGRDDAAEMYFSDHDIKQLDDDYLHGLLVGPLLLLSKKLLADLKEAHDRLNQKAAESEAEGAGQFGTCSTVEAELTKISP
jgi:hypothetical protein